MKTSTSKTTSTRPRRLACLLALFIASVLSVAAEDYGFYFAGVYVNSSNCNPIAHQSNIFEQGTATYNSSTKTLTLTNVTVTRSGSGKNCIDNVKCPGLNVVLKGNCYLYSQDDYAVVTRDANVNNKDNSTKITVEGSATIESKNKSALCYQEDDDWMPRFINGPGTLTLKSTNSYAMEGTSMTTIYFDEGLTATLNGGKGALHNFGDIDVKNNCELTLKATNNSSYPIVSQVSSLYFLNASDNEHWDLNGDGYLDGGDEFYEYKHPALLKPWGGQLDPNHSSILYNGTPIYDRDIVISNRYDILVIKEFFPDDKFRAYMSSKYPKMYLTLSDTQALTDLNVSGKSISSMKGLHYLKSVKTLNCSNNNITELDLSKNSALTSVNCSYNQLTSLEVIGKPNLTTLICNNNYGLTELDCQGNALTSLNINSCSNLEKIVCYGNKFTSLNLSNRSKLKTLDCRNNSQLTTLNCYSDVLTSLLVAGCSKLATINCSGNKFTNLTCSSLPNLTTLNCSDNKQLTTLNCSKNALTSLNISGCTELKKLYCYQNNFEMLEVAGFKKLTTLECNDNSQLWSLYCSGNALTDLTLSGCNSLIELNCSSNAFTSLSVTNLPSLLELNVSSNPNLTSLDCINNALTTLEVYDCGALKTLDCNNNHLKSIDLSDCVNLGILNCSFNELESIDLSNNSELTCLYGQVNKLTALDLSANSKLTDIECHVNKLVRLDVSHCAELKVLECYSNDLTSLSVSGCSKLEHLDCAFNELPRLVLPQNDMNLISISCYCNKLKGAGIKEMVASLPDRRNLSESGGLYVFYEGNQSEQNVCSTQNVHDAWMKNWKTYYITSSSLDLYDGCEVVIPTDVHEIETGGNTDAPRYNLGGQRVGDNYKGIVIQRNKKTAK